ncbi:MAG: HNH endonuclease signature motif containing protein [Acidimicrobiales bacterium]
MSAVIDPPELLSDDVVLERCREIERRRRADLAEHVRLLHELERRRLYFADGHRDLAGFGRAEYRWADRDAKAHRDLERLCRQCPQVLDHLTTGRVGAAQAFLLARTARAPRVGIYVAEQIDDFLQRAAELSYLAFEQFVLAWKCLMDIDGPDPDRAHRDRTANYGRAGLVGTFSVEGTAYDLERLKVLMARFEQIEFDHDWATAQQTWGDDASIDKLLRTPSQRRYDAFQNLLDHVVLPHFTDTGDTGDTGEAVDSDSGTTTTTDTTNAATGADATACDEVRPPVETILNLVIDGETFLHALERLLGISLQRPVRTPFGPDRGSCQTFDGNPVDARDAVLAGLAGRIRILLRNDDGTIRAMTSAQRLFTGAIRDAVLATATHCTHPGCTVPATRCQIDHMHPASHGGCTSTYNGCVRCGHHNRWRHRTGATVTRQPDGTITTHRADGTRIAPPL